MSRGPFKKSDIQPYYARACELTDSGPADFIDATPPISPLPMVFAWTCSNAGAAHRNFSGCTTRP